MSGGTGDRIKNSPVTFEVLPAAPAPPQSKLIPPDGFEHPLPADLQMPVKVLLRTCDKFGNACMTGGLRIIGRLQLVKQSSTDNSILMPNNHSVIIDDKDDGTYEVMVAVMITATVKLIVNMDKVGPASTTIEQLAVTHMHFFLPRIQTDPLRIPLRAPLLIAGLAGDHWRASAGAALV